MAKNINHLQHVKSNVVESGLPKLPSPSVLVEGEIAVNYAADHETISLKNSSGVIVAFSSDNYYSEKKLGSGFTGTNSAVTVTEIIEENELITATALADLNNRKMDLSAYTPTDLSNYYNKTQVDAKVNGVSGVVSSHTTNTQIHTSAVTMNGATLTTSGGKIALGKVVSAATLNGTAVSVTNAGVLTLTGVALSSDLTGYVDGTEYNSNDKKIYFKHGNTTLSSLTIDATDFIKDGMVESAWTEDVSGTTYLKIKWNNDGGDAITDIDIGDLFEADNYYDKDDIDEILGSGFTGENTGLTITKAIEDNEIVIAAALSDLDSRKMDASAYTETDLSNYYNKQQVDQKVSGVSGVVSSHISDTSIHVTTAQTAAWDGAVASSHTHTNKAILDNISSTDITNWNNKVSAITINNGNKTTPTNGVVNVTVPTKLSDITSAHTHPISEVTNLQTTLNAKVSAVTINGGTKTPTNGVVALGKLVSSATVNGSAQTVTDAGVLQISGVTANADFTAHTANTTAHITAAERTSWDSRLSGVALNGSAVTVTDNVAAITGVAMQSYVDERLGSGFTGENSGRTVTGVIQKVELVTSAALNDLNANKMDASAYTPTDLSDYYTKTEVDGKLDTKVSAITINNGSQITPTNGVVNVTVPTALSQITSAHTHAISDVTNLQTTLNAKVSAVTINGGTKTPTNGVVALGKVVSAATVNGTSATVTDAGVLQLTGITTNNDFTAHTTNGQIHTSAVTMNGATISASGGKIALGTVVSAMSLNGTNQTVTNGKVSLSGIAMSTDLDSYPDNATYNSTDKKIYFKHGNTTLANMTIDASDFIVDGMVSSVTLVELSGDTYLRVTWNTDAGSTVTDLNIGDIFDADNYYDKDDIDEILGSGFTGENSGLTITQVIEEDEFAIATALNDLDSRKMDASAYTAAISDFYTKEEIEDKEEVIAAALVDLDDRFDVVDRQISQIDAKADSVTRSLSQYTPMGYSFSKAETNTMIADLSAVVDRKADASTVTASINNIETTLGTAIENREKKMEIVSGEKTSDFTAEVGKYYKVRVGNNATLTVTLPTTGVSTTYVQSIVFYVTLGTGTSQIQFSNWAAKTEGFDYMDAGSTYEINAMWNGSGWIMAMSKLITA